MRTIKLEGEDSMSFQYDQQHLSALLEATRAAALEFLESLATRPAGRTPQTLPHDALPVIRHKVKLPSVRLPAR